MYSVEDLIAFVSIVEKGSVTGAANSMDLDPATVSRRLSKLETKLGVSLIKRSTRRMAITSEGNLFYKHAVAAIRLLQQAEQSVLTPASETSSDSISIAGPHWLIQDLLVSELQNIIDAQDATLELLGCETSDTLPSQAAICFSVGQYSVASEHQVCLLRNRTVLCAAPAYLARHGGVSSAQDLASRTCMASRANHVWTLKDATGVTSTISAGKHLLCDDDATLMSLARAGQGIVALNSVHAAKALRAGELIEILPGLLHESDRNIYLHSDSNRYAMNGVESCYKAIQKSMSGQ